jgi:hypothetical protein
MTAPRHPPVWKSKATTFIPSDPVEATVRTKAYAAMPAELGQSVRKEDAGHEPVRSIVFPNGRNGVRSFERSLAVDQNVFVWCYREIKRAFATVQFFNSPGFRNKPSASIRSVPLLRWSNC